MQSQSSQVRFICVSPALPVHAHRRRGFNDVVWVAGGILMVRSYELGVLFLPSLESAYRGHRHCGFSCTDKAPILLPAGNTTEHESHPGNYIAYLSTFQEPASCTLSWNLWQCACNTSHSALTWLSCNVYSLLLQDLNATWMSVKLQMFNRPSFTQRLSSKSSSTILSTWANDSFPPAKAPHVGARIRKPFIGAICSHECELFIQLDILLQLSRTQKLNFGPNLMSRRQQVSKARSCFPCPSICLQQGKRCFKIAYVKVPAQTCKVF